MHTFPSNIVYYVDPVSLEIKERVKMGFGKAEFNPDEMPADKPKQFYRSYLEAFSNKYAFVSGVRENDQYVFVFYYFNKKYFVARFNKKTKELQNGYSSFNKPGQFPPGDLLIGNCLYYVCEPQYVKYVVSDDLLDKKLIEVIGCLQNTDNKVIIKYHLK